MTVQQSTTETRFALTGAVGATYPAGYQNRAARRARLGGAHSRRRARARLAELEAQAKANAEYTAKLLVKMRENAATSLVKVDAGLPEAEQ